MVRKDSKWGQLGVCAVFLFANVQCMFSTGSQALLKDLQINDKLSIPEIGLFMNVFLFIASIIAAKATK